MLKLKEKKEAPVYTIDGKALALEMVPTINAMMDKKLSETLSDIKNMHSDDELIDCPTCNITGSHNGHSHKLKNNGRGTLQCTGPNCKSEFHLIPADPDIQCTTCGTPTKRVPKELEDSQTCPTCGRNHFKMFDKKLLKR